MEKDTIFLFLLFVGVGLVEGEPVQACTENTRYLADDNDLCRFHWCLPGFDSPLPMQCPPGARVATWFTSSSTDQESPCSQDHSTEKSCLRCGYNDVRPAVNSFNYCEPNPCSSGCTCQSLWDQHYCACPSDVVPIYEEVTSGNFYCSPDPCRNGATCHSQWDDYWCECPPGYTGKNCETPFCDPNPCRNGGVCRVDEISYSCDCGRCFEGPCCERPVGAIPGCSNTIVNVTTPVTVTTTTPPIRCPDCQFGDSCQFTRNELCSCNPCPQSGQLCIDRQTPNPRDCLGKPGPYGNQYTMTFSQDSGDADTFKRVYVYKAGSDVINGMRTIRIYTPDTPPGDPCFVDTTVTINSNQPAFYDIAPECLNTESEEIQTGRILRVLDTEGREIVVTVSNMDGDGYLAIPDSNAGQYFVSHAYSRSGSQSYITIVALADNTLVSIKRPDEEVFRGTTPTSAVVEFQLNGLQSIRYSRENLAGSVIVSTRNIHVWSGNLDENSQKTIEQLPSVNRWGSSVGHKYIIVGVATSSVDTFDDVHVQTARETTYTLYRIIPSGEKMLIYSNRTAAGGTEFFLGSLGVGEVFELITDEPVQVTHSIRAQVANGQNFHSSYTLIPAIEQYAQSYSFQTHGRRQNTGRDFTRHYLTLVTAREVLADVPDYFEQLVIYHFDILTGSNMTFTPEQLGARWMQVDGTYWTAVVELPSPGVYYLSNPSLPNSYFGSVYYAVSGQGQSQLPNAAFPLGYDMSQLNDIPKPTLCPRCTSGPNCATPVINTCACNPCPNFDDQCTDSTNPRVPRLCQGTADTTGNPFTLMYMQNRPDNTEKRELELYVTSAGTSSRPVRVHTPSLSPSHPCYFNITRVIPGFEVSLFTIPDAECFETVGSGVFTDKAIRVQSDDGRDLLVYAVNRDQFSADGWVAFPDSQAGTDYYTVSHNPPVYGSEFAVVNSQSEEVDISLTYTGRATPNIAGTQFRLNAGDVLQIQSSGDLSGTRIQSSGPVNVYSGNIRALVREVEDESVGNINTGSRDHLVEQLLPVNRWGKTFHIVPIPDRRFGDQLKVVAQANGTVSTLFRRHPDGTLSEETFALNSGELFSRDIISDNTYRLSSNEKIFVVQITKSQERGSNIHDPSLITVPPVEQYTNRYIFNTPLFSGGSAVEKRPYRFRRLLISARDEDRNGIRIIHDGTSTFVSSIGVWRQVPGTNYYNTAVDLQDGTSLILHDRDDVSFMCIFYGYDDRESLGFPIGMRLQII